MDSINILYGVAWLFGGLVLLSRAMKDKARPSASTSSLSQPGTQTEEQRRWGLWLSVVLYLMLGVLYFLKAIFSRR